MKQKNDTLLKDHNMTVSESVLIEADNIYMASFIIKATAATGTLLIKGLNIKNGLEVTLDSTAITASTYHVKLDQVHTKYLKLQYTAGGAGLLTVEVNLKGA